jgi:hypothetical protein
VKRNLRKVFRRAGSQAAICLRTGDLKEATLAAFGQPPAATLPLHARQQIFFALFETLNWLDTLLLRVKEEALEIDLDADLRKALQFIRGRVHHKWANAIEFREHVPVEGVPGVMLPDWCWRQPEAVPGRRRSGSEREEREYRAVLGGKRTRDALDEVARTAGGLFAA